MWGSKAQEFEFPYTVCYREWVHVLSSEDVRNEVYSLKDVLIPTIGAATIYPGNRVADR